MYHSVWKLSLNLFAAIVLTGVILASTASAESDPTNTAVQDRNTVLITGANRGIGLELARRYAAAGWHVIGTARKPDTADELRAVGADVMQLDVTDPDSISRLAADLDDAPLDMLVNNAGILPFMPKLADVDFGDYERTLAVNTTGPARVTQALLPNLKAGNGKKIINVTSNLGSITDNTSGGFYGYRESKAGLNTFTRSLAAEFGPEGFICIVINPGWVRTDMGGPNAPLSVEESGEGIVSVIEGLAPADNGTFWTHAGENMDW